MKACDEQAARARRVSSRASRGSASSLWTPPERRDELGRSPNAPERARRTPDAAQRTERARAQRATRDRARTQRALRRAMIGAVQLDFAAREVTIKLVYYGPALSGKTTNLSRAPRAAPAPTRAGG